MSGMLMRRHVVRGVAAAADPLAPTIPANAVYVSPSGNDTTGTGSLAAPFATAGKVNTSTYKGRTIVFRQGTYIAQPWAFGTASTPQTVVMSYPGEVATFVDQMTNFASGSVRNVRLYRCVLRNKFQVRGGTGLTGDQTVLISAHDIWLDRCEVTNEGDVTSGNCVFAWNHCTNFKFTRCVLHHTGEPTGQLDHAFYLNDPDSGLIQDCVMYHMYGGWGVQFYPAPGQPAASGVTVEYCTITECRGGVIFGNGSGNPAMQNNGIRNSILTNLHDFDGDNTGATAPSKSALNLNFTDANGVGNYFADNAYFDISGTIPAGSANTVVVSGNTSVDPQYVDAAGRNYKPTNATLLSGGTPTKGCREWTYLGPGAPSVTAQLGTEYVPAWTGTGIKTVGDRLITIDVDPVNAATEGAVTGYGWERALANGSGVVAGGWFGLGTTVVGSGVSPSEWTDSLSTATIVTPAPVNGTQYAYRSFSLVGSRRSAYSTTIFATSVAAGGGGTTTIAVEYEPFPNSAERSLIPAGMATHANSTTVVNYVLSRLRALSVALAVSGEVPALNVFDKPSGYVLGDYYTVSTGSANMAIKFPVPNPVVLGSGADSPCIIRCKQAINPVGVGSTGPSFPAGTELRIWHVTVNHGSKTISGTYSGLFNYTTGDGLPIGYGTGTMRGNGLGDGRGWSGLGYWEQLDQLGKFTNAIRFSMNSGWGQNPAFVPPAIKSDQDDNNNSSPTGAMKMGYRFQLQMTDAEINARTVSTNNAGHLFLLREFCRVGRDYGLYLGDGGGSGVFFELEDYQSGLWSTKCGPYNINADTGENFGYGHILRGPTYAGYSPGSSLSRASDGVPWDKLRLLASSDF